MKYLLLFIYCALATTTFAKSKHKVLFREKNFADTVKIKYQNGTLLVPLTINDKEYDFVFDTGATMFMLKADGYENLVKSSLENIIVGDFHKKRGSLKHGLMCDFSVGNVNISGYEYVVMNNNVKLQHDGIWGAADLLQSGISIKIDLKDSILILTDKKHFFDSEEGYKIHYRSPNSYINVDFSMLNGCNGSARFDTGQNSFLTINKQEYYDPSVKGNQGDLFQKQIEWRDSGSIMQSVNGKEDVIEHIYMRIEHLNVGDITFENIPADVYQGLTTIGSRILEHGNIVIDPIRKRLKYQPYTNNNIVNINGHNKDFHIADKNDKIYVAMINPKSDAYIKGLRKGFCLIEYNNHPIRCINDFLEAKNAIRDKKVKVIFQNSDGKQVELLIDR